VISIKMIFEFFGVNFGSPDAASIYIWHKIELRSVFLSVVQITSPALR